MSQAYIHKPNSTNLMMQGIQQRMGYDSLDQQAKQYKGGSSRVSGRAFPRTKKKTRKEEKHETVMSKAKEDMASAAIEKTKAETDSIKRDTEQKNLMKEKEVSDLDKARIEESKERTLMSRKKRENLGQEKKLNELEKVHLKQKELNYATEKFKSAKSFLPNVTQKTYRSWHDWSGSNKLIPDGVIPTPDDMEKMKPIEFNQAISKIMGSNISKKDIYQAKNIEIREKRLDLDRQRFENKKDVVTLNRLHKQLEGEDGEDINNLSPENQQEYFRIEDKINKKSNQVGGTLFLTPSVQAKMKKDSGNDDLTKKQMQIILNKTNARNKRIDTYVMKNKANPELVAQIMERDGRTEIQVLRALANNGIRFESNKRNIIKGLIEDGIAKKLTMSEARKNAFSIYIQKLNESRGS